MFKYLCIFSIILSVNSCKLNKKISDNEAKDFFNNRSKEDAVNVLALIKGKEKPDEYIVISAHYDHLGVDVFCFCM